MSFQMVLLHEYYITRGNIGFGTLSFQMVLLPMRTLDPKTTVLEPCHSRWFYYFCEIMKNGEIVLEPCHSRWFYYS